MFKTMNNMLSENPESIPWISASNMRNYCQNNQLVDFLKTLDKVDGIKRDKGDMSLIEQGNKFEELVVEYIGSKLGIEVVKISSEPWDITPDKVSIARKYIKEKKEKVLASVPFMNKSNNTRGVIDLLVRSDVLCDLFENVVDSGEDIYYVPVEVKFSGIDTRKDGHISSQLYWKVQLYVYKLAVENIDRCNIRRTYVIGRTLSCNKKMVCDEAVREVGIVDYGDYDDYIVELYSKALEWARKMKRNEFLMKNWGREEGLFDVTWIETGDLPPEELYPSKLSSNDYEYYGYKKEIMMKLNDPKLISYVSNNEKLTKGGFMVEDWEPTSMNKERDEYRRAVRIARTQSIPDYIFDVMYPERFKGDIIRGDEETLILFIDFETLSNSRDDFSNFPKRQGDTSIFMIGVYNPEEDKYICFKRMIHEIDDVGCVGRFIEYLECFNRSNVILYHWAPAERSFFKGRGYELPVYCKFVDLCKIIMNSIVTVKGALNYKLKPFFKAMVNNKLVKDVEEDGGDCDGGLIAQNMGYDYYYKNVGNEFCNKILNMNNIEKYNNNDCVMVWRIYDFVLSWVSKFNYKKND